MDPVIYFKRAFRPEPEATISVRSRALNYGLGCFGGIRAYRTDEGTQVHVFRLDRHVRRLEQSAHILRLRLPGSVETMAGIIVELLRRNEMRGDAYVRPIVFANSNELSPILDPETSETAIFCAPLGRYLSSGAIDVCVSSWRRVRENALPARAKATGGYLNSALARREAIDHGYTEAILLTEDGHVSEGSAEHVFIVREGRLISPPSTEDNLDGITRQSLIALAQEDLGIPFVERPIGRTELYVADEMFLCGTGAEITPVRSVDRRTIGDGQVGPVTTRLSAHFEAVVRGRVQARHAWLTPVW
ncbi:MAG: branched-chain-amino-acid transaminase [Acidobacteria bacterium SCN 69-37]|nr:MAG: branched-chain-amino-acid transaminase [Acidobacteria bacterium SCN 69-37]